MLRNFFNEKTGPIDVQIDAVLTEMSAVGVNSSEYSELMTKLERLTQVKTEHRQLPVSRDTLALIFGNLLVTLVIVAYEQKHVWTTKAPSQLITLKAQK